MSNKLSIVIPCYNCAGTLREAVDSCYIQGLTDEEFEIIMVDDGSSDQTRILMEEIKNEHTNIHLIFHPENRGGGAARNTGIAAAQGEIIYCLDSDNLFAPNSVRTMLEYMHETGADGVAFYERRFFVGNNKKKYTSHLNKLNRPIKLFDILSNNETMLDNFFYTTESFKRTLGYPEHHGFDTQSFEIRFLSTGNSVLICPNSYFWHRQSGGKKSYFERVYESGEFSLNIYYMMEDIMHLLSDGVRSNILEFNIFENSKLDNKNLQKILMEKYGKSEDLLFRPDHKHYIKPDGFNAYHKSFGVNDALINAIWLYRNTQYSEACSVFMKLLKQYNGSKVLFFNIMRCCIGYSESSAHQDIEKMTIAQIQSMVLRRQKINLNPNIFRRLGYVAMKNIRRFLNQHS